VWGANEQRDQVFLVDWVAKQPWSDGNVGFYGQSYVGTTAVEAAIHAPAALKAIIAVAPVTDAYNDWHFGGVPNGENTLSPVGYQLLGAGGAFPPLGSTRPESYLEYGTDLQYLAARADNGFCDPTLMPRANDPRAIYDAFYEERNLSASAGPVTAAVLYTQGFEDSNVKSALIPDWFNALTSPKLGLFGHWVHQHPTRADNEALFLLWLDQHVKGKPVGFEKLPSVRALTNDGRERVGDAWPAATDAFTLHLDPAGGRLSDAPARGFATILMDSARGTLPVSLATLPLAQVRLEMESAPLAAPVELAGSAVVHVEATLQHAQNAYVAAYLYETRGDERALVTWGMFNVAHRDGHDRYVPVAPGERFRIGIPLLPTEWTFRPGAVLTLELHGAAIDEWALTPPTEPGALDVHAEGSALELPVATGATPMPVTARR
ncbi:MAG TPA: CocE/NonD family hydrolase, partial [Candidatus Thermoplasmatota archaeon]|nr:CocE/NonD family hydrolase [Candidatus Thermoplasmatota archaeon]